MMRLISLAAKVLVLDRRASAHPSRAVDGLPICPKYPPDTAELCGGMNILYPYSQTIHGPP
jgi:hypothetical protein